MGSRRGNTELRDKVQATLEEMAADGTLKSVSEKWFGEDVTTIGKVIKAAVWTCCPAG